MKLQIVSDIHLETRPFPPRIEKHADYIALLGDIGNVIGSHNLKKYEYLLLDLKEKFTRVFLIAGNHEYYGKIFPFDQCHTILKELASKCGVIFLEKDEYQIPGTDIIILGSTLWTAGRKKIKPSINDYHFIKYNEKRLLSFEDTYNFHQENVAWLKTKINEHHDKRLIILTHHAPLLEGIKSPHCTDEYSIFYGSDLSTLMLSNVKIWAFGHTHHCADFYYGDTRIVTNAMGYNHEKTGFKEDFVVELAQGDQ